MRFIQLILLTFCCTHLGSALGAAESFRTWTSSTGQKLEAKLLGFDAAKLQLVSRQGEILVIPRQAFSEQDRAFLEQLPGPMPLLEKPFVRMQTTQRRGRDVNRKILPISSDGDIISYAETRDPESMLQVSATLTSRSACDITLISYLAHPRENGGFRFQKMEEKREFLSAGTPLESFILTFEEKPKTGGIASRGQSKPKPEWLVVMYWEGIYMDHKASKREVTRGKGFEKLKTAMLREQAAN
jgi:hypothetical protein